MTDRNWLHVGCESGHDWRSLGGCNAGCDEECCCSVPVNECHRCHICDYGHNDEAEHIRRDCALTKKEPAPAEAETGGGTEL